MTEDNTPRPTKKTSAVPLRKETVRVTLKATPQETTDGDADKPAAPPVPAPTIPLSKPTDSGAPVVPPPPTTVELSTLASKAPVPPPAPTVQLSTPTSKPPTVKLQTASQAKNPVAAPTVAGSTFAGAEHLVPPPKPATLKISSPDFEQPAADETADATVPAPAPTVGLATPATTQPTGQSSQPMPVVTVQLQQGQAATAPIEGQGPDIQTVSIAAPGEEVEQKEEAAATIMSVAALVAALILLGVQLSTANTWVNDVTHDNPGWGRLFE